VSLKEIVESGSGHVHMTGICGFGMSGLAVLLKARGFDVSGCDVSPGKIGDWLSAQGIEAEVGHNDDHISKDMVAGVRSTAVRMDNSEIAAAVGQGVPVFQRGEVLASLLPGKKSIAVGGTHGKTTTACFVAQLLKSADKSPSWCIGGDCDVLGGFAGTGTGDCIVVEADESDGTLVLYSPDIAVLTNVEFDHAEHFGNEAELKKCFAEFVKNTKQTIVF
jgi:UDP-N-acetylmuramate--alanine ligase